MKVDFVEIGTSDFNTEIEKAQDYQHGISIEAVSYYHNKLPKKENVITHHLAISDVEGECSISYVDPEIIHSLHGSHMWMKGCNKIDVDHPLLTSFLLHNNLKKHEVLITEKVKKRPLLPVLSEDTVTGIYYLKIDTEGHDVVILRKFLYDISFLPRLLPHMIMFESNTNIPTVEVDHMIEKLQEFGYVVMNRGEDTIVRLQLPRCNAYTFTTVFENYYIQNYPNNYDPNNLPHPNTIQGAKEYCRNHNCSGVTFQDGRYEVRSGPWLLPVPEHFVKSVRSWAFV